MIQEQLDAVHGLIRTLERRWVLPHPPADVFHIYEPFPHWDFFSGLEAAEPFVRDRSFIDAGCGIGNLLLIMHLLGYEVTGVDHHPHYIAAARDLCPDATLHLADIRDVQDYDAGIVFMNRPAIKTELQRAFDSHVVSRARSGTVLFFPSEPLDPGLPVEPIADRWLWVRT